VNGTTINLKIYKRVAAVENAENSDNRFSYAEATLRLGKMNI
jgi:hypothetical protein